jgi:hypothetical protein
MMQQGLCARPVRINEELLPVFHGHLAILLCGAVHHLNEPLAANMTPDLPHKLF